MGGGNDGFAFICDKDFNTVSSHSSQTYGNQNSLVDNGSKDEVYKISNVEVWGFENYITNQKTIPKKSGSGVSNTRGLN
jgi:hypothetical protein